MNSIDINEDYVLVSGTWENMIYISYGFCNYDNQMYELQIEYNYINHKNNFV